MHRPAAYASVQSDQCLCDSLVGKYNIKTCFMDLPMDTLPFDMDQSIMRDPLSQYEFVVFY